MIAEPGVFGAGTRSHRTFVELKNVVAQFTFIVEEEILNSFTREE